MYGSNNSPSTETDDPTFDTKAPKGCAWAEWGEWTICSKTCEKGVMKRNRVKIIEEDDGENCIGEGFDEKICNQHPCPGLLYAELLFLNHNIIQIINQLC